jgi:nitrate reductase molybdenum cofactor assembly chaperone NarJ/NarW
VIRKQRAPVPWALLSYLLRYPEDGLAQAPAAIAELPDGEVRACLEQFVEGLPDPVTLRAAYVDTFDLQRRATPYLTFYEHGDTRRRGAALLRLKRLYREAGLEFDSDELPDHRAVMLAFAELAPDGYGDALLTEYRPALEMLRTGVSGPYAYVVEAVCLALPPLRGDQRDKAAMLAEQGPPGEQVGIDPYVPDEVMPR